MNEKAITDLIQQHISEYYAKINMREVKAQTITKIAKHIIRINCNMEQDANSINNME